MKKELRFISNCFNINYQVKSKKILEDLANKNLDWDLILKILIKSDIAPLAFHNLSSFKNNKIPLSFMSELGKKYYYSLAKNLFIQKTLNDTLTLFYNEKIPSIALKGLFMGDIIYENISLRTLNDIDILVKKTDLQQVDRLLQQNGYMKFKEYPAQISYSKDNDAAQNCFKRISIDVHYDLHVSWTSSIISPDFLWYNTITKDVNGVTTSYPSLENSIIYAVLHFFRHFSVAFICRDIYFLPLPQLKFILDIHEIISMKQDEIDWNYILDFCDRNNTKYILYFSLILSKNYFNTNIPCTVTSRIKPSFQRNFIIHTFLNSYIKMQNKKISYKTMFWTKRVYYSLFKKPYSGDKILTTVSKFAKNHDLPEHSFKTFLLYALRPFLWAWYR